MRVSARGIAAGLAVLVVAGVCVRLGFWQLDRLEQRREANAARSAAAALPPLELDRNGLLAVMADPAAHLYRRARVSGTYQYAEEVVLRGRSYGGRPGVHLVTPLRPPFGEAVVLVNRGWVSSPDAATIDPATHREPDLRGAEGVLHQVPISGAESAPASIRLGDRALLTLRRLDLPTLQLRFDDPLLPLYVQLTPTGASAPDHPVRVPPPALDDGPHLGYALQWFSFAGIALFGFGYFVWVHGRRKERV